jgi:dihydroorotase
VFDPDAEWTVVPAKLASKSRNTPYAGRTLRARCATPSSTESAVVVDSTAQR